MEPWNPQAESPDERVGGASGGDRLNPPGRGPRPLPLFPTFFDNQVPYWRRLAVDSLVLYGEKDKNVPSLKSAEILRSLGRPNIDVKVYEGSGHALESPAGEGQSIFREDALRDIRDFIRSTSMRPQ